MPTPPGNMHLAAPSPTGHGPAYPGPVRRASPEPVHRTARTTYLTRLPARAGVARRYRACKHQSGRVPDRPLSTSTDRPLLGPGPASWRRLRRTDKSLDVCPFRSRDLRRLKPLAAGDHGNSLTTKPRPRAPDATSQHRWGGFTPNHPTLLSVGDENGVRIP